MVEIGKVLGGGFRLLQERPGSVAIWGVVSLVAGIAIAFAQISLIGVQPPVQRMAIFPSAEHIIGQLGFSLLSLLVQTVLWAAAFRSVLEPENRAFASLRLGMDEVRMMVVAVLIYLLWIAAAIFGVLGFTFLAGLFALATGGDPGTAAALVIVLFLILFAAIAFVSVRLSLVMPLVLVRKRIGIDESWALTGPHFWPLLGAYILMALIFVGIALVLLLPVFAAGMAELGAGAGFGSDRVAEALAAGKMPPLSATLILAVIAGTAMGALQIALLGGMLGTATREILAMRDPEDDPESPL